MNNNRSNLKHNITQRDPWTVLKFYQNDTFDIKNATSKQYYQSMDETRANQS